MLKNVIIFAIETGLRLGEIINLNWLDIDKNVATFDRQKMEYQDKFHYLKSQ